MHITFRAWPQCGAPKYKDKKNICATLRADALLYAGAYSREQVKKAATLPKYFVIGGKDGGGEYI